MFTCTNFGSFAAISLLSTCNNTRQYQACFSLFHTINACKINQSDVQTVKVLAIYPSLHGHFKISGRIQCIYNLITG